MAGGRLKLTPHLAGQFLKILYGPFFSQDQGGAFIEVRGKREEKGMDFRKFYPNPEALLADMPRWDPARNYWQGVALRRDNQGGAKQNLLALTALFCDVDCGPAGHKKAPTYQTKAEALAAIEKFPLRPTMLIDSGGGYQPYWCYREPIELTDGNLARVERINRGLAAVLGGDMAATDASRILRLPGTFNMKITGNPRPVGIVWCEPERAYDLADFARYEAKGKARAQEAPRGPDKPGGGGEYEAYAQKALADELARLARTPEGERNTQLNQSAFALGQLIGAGVLDRGSVEAALYGVAISIGLGEVESRTTIKSGLDAGMREPRRLPEKEAGAKGREKRKAGAQAQGDPQGQEEGEPIRIPWVGHFYCVKDERLCKADYDGKKWEYKPLANFQARIEEEVTRDDGLRPFKEFHITGSLDTGQPLPLVQIPAKEYDCLNWVRREWGAAATVAPGRSHGPHLVNAIQAHSQGFNRRAVFTHTGWRQINGVWRYLHGGGAIGQGEPVEVDLGKNLHLYRLSEPGGIEAAQASLRFLDIGPWEITAPLISCIYLAPFADLCKIDFSLWIYGSTGSLKSTLAALALSHYGNFSHKTLPGSWLSTANSLEKLTFTLKDTLCVIDDFIPASTAKESHAMRERAGRLIYQAGNRSGRGRLAPDLSARPDQYPRGLIISTGEILLPGKRASATARYLGIELEKEKISIDRAQVTAAQREQGLYPQAMAAYLEHLAPRLEDTRAEICALWEEYRGAYQGTAHLRIPEIQAWLVVGFELFLRFQARMEAISQDVADQMLKQAWRVFEALGEKHSWTIKGERPTLKFLAVLRELFYQGRVYVESATVAGASPPALEALGWEGTEPAKNAEFVGWADDGTLFLIPEMTFKAVNETIHRQGDYFPLGKNDLLAALATEGFIKPGREGNTEVKSIRGSSKRVIFLPLLKLFHDEASDDEKK
jgi:hypothetical protein